MADPALVDQLANGISGIESGGDYGARGPVTKTGDRAYGKYQIMGTNVPAWTEEAGVGRMSPDQFVMDPDAQEKTARYKMGQYLDAHGGSLRDAASMWHSGVPYDQAVSEGRADQLGTTTQSYADRVAGGGGGGDGVAEAAELPDVKVRLPDGTLVNLGPNPSEELKQQVKQKIVAKFPQLNNFNTPLSGDEEQQFQAWKQQYAPNDSGDDYDLRGAFKEGLQPDPTTGHWPDTYKKPNHPTFSDESKYAAFGTPGKWTGPNHDQYVPGTKPTPAAPPATPIRAMDVDNAGRALNQALGRDPEDKTGKYVADIAKPMYDALDDVRAAFTEVNPASTGNPFELSTWKDALDRSLKLLHPLGVVGEAAGNLVQQLATDAGASPGVAAGLGLAASMAGGYYTPVPGLKPGEVPKMPLQGTKATRAAAGEAAGAAGQAEAQAAAAARASEAAANEIPNVASRGEQWAAAQRGTSAADTAAAQAEADAAQQAAETAGAQAAPSTAAAGRAKAALTPGEVSPTAGSAAATSALETKLREIKDPVQGIYEGLIDDAEAHGRSLDPTNYMGISRQIDALKSELGPTLSGQSEQVIDNIAEKINTGQRLTARDMDAYKQQLDTLLPGRTPRGATPKQAALWQFKWDVRDMMRSMYDSEGQKWAEAADTLWRDTIIGKDNPTALGNLVQLAKKNPATFAERVFGTGANEKQGVFARAVMNELGDHPAATQLRQGVLARAIDQATNGTTGELDPAALLKRIDAYSGTFRKAMLEPEQEAFFKQLAKEQAEAPVAATTAKAAAKTAAETAKAGDSAVAAAERTADVGTKQAETAANIAERTARGAEKAADQARTAADTAAELARRPNKLAWLTAKGLEIGGIEAFRHFGLSAPPGLAEAASLFIPRDRLATAIADSKTANLLVRALRTGLDSPAIVTIVEAIRNRDRSVKFLGR